MIPYIQDLKHGSSSVRISLKQSLLTCQLQENARLFLDGQETKLSKCTKLGAQNQLKYQQKNWSQNGKGYTNPQANEHGEKI